MYDKRFPDNYPKNLMNLILEAGAKEQSMNVYRVCTKGKVNRDAFNSSFVDKLLRNQNTVNRDALQNKVNRDFDITIDEIEEYSTSCYEKLKDIKNTLRMMQKHYPEPIVAKGVTKSCCGPSIRSKELSVINIKRKHIKSHVDWWIYDNTNPQDYFSEIKIGDDE